MSASRPDAPKRDQAIDWAALRARLDAARHELEDGSGHSAEHVRAILEARAAALAREPALESEAATTIEVVEFMLAHERYGLDTAFILEVYPLKELATVPCTPSFVLGIINLRGRILSVIDIKKFFNLPEKGLTDLNRVIVLSSGQMEFGVLADAILGVRSVALHAMQTELPGLIELRREYLHGITPDGMIVLDASKILADDQIVVHDEVAG